MFGIGSGELFIIILVSLLFLGPKELLSVAKSLGNLMGKINATFIRFQREINLALYEDENKTVFDPKDIAKAKIDQRIARLTGDNGET
ncbi:MAG: twin-arginine translocase TatA/TatE family subunit [Deltaproteobacteria bacterium]|nr:twin-arginine translocase TatA/TatE family subunit [Deltaproteobacteria bacterium]MCX7952026.1 twin-arginine translocase TatA/TatE family subunit [Deltaproteobacteria bacterium]